MKSERIIMDNTALDFNNFNHLVKDHLMESEIVHNSRILEFHIDSTLVNEQSVKKFKFDMSNTFYVKASDPYISDTSIGEIPYLDWTVEIVSHIKENLRNLVYI